MAEKANKTFRITGRVIDSTTQEGIAGLRVDAWDKDSIFDDLVGSDVTDEQGAFQIAFTESHFKELFLDLQPDVFFKVFREDELIKSTEDSVLWNVAAGETEVVIEVDIPAVGKPEETFVVRGQVRLSDGSPCVGALVRAYDKDLRSKEPLGKSEPVTTETEGRYEITYTAEQFSRVEKRSADLLMEARQNEKADWIAAPIRFNAQPVEIVNVTLDGVYRGPSEFRRLVDEITPLLDGLTLAQLKENSEFQDITFLSNEAGVDRQLIAWLAVSALRAQEEDLLQHEEYYGLFCQNLPTDLDALLAQETEALRGALETSARDNIVRAMAEQDLADFVSRVQQLQSGLVLRPAGPNEPASLGDLLAVAVDAEKRELVATYFVEHGGATDAFWKALEEDSGVEPDDVKAVKQTLALGTFTDNHLPLVRELYQMGKGTAAFAELRGFAQLDEEEWQALLQRPQEPGENSKPIGFPPGQESIEAYARTLNQTIENAFPMAVISNRLERDNSNESPFKEAKADLLVFFANNPEFSFTETPPDLYLSDEASEKLRDIENPEVLRAQLKSMQRVFNVTPHFPEIRALLVDDLHSATAMVYVGEGRFIEKYAEPLGGISKAREAYRKAEHVHATALNVYMKHSVAFNSPLPYVISDGETRMPDPQTPVAYTHLQTNFFRERGADLRTLFGSLDLCDCQHCQSLYSPAAYFVDILKFLDGGPTTNDMSPLQVLLTRRPDIVLIELTCDNTNTQLPYVDLTNEILEAAIVPRSFEIETDADISSVLAALNAGEISSWMKTAFINNGYALSDKASLRIDRVAGDDTSRLWIILDSGWAFTLTYFGEGFGVVASPQTSWTSDELRGNPEHIHDPAYTVLRGAVYPWNLPLNLPLEEMRVYLGHLRAARHEVMEILFRGTASDALSDQNIADEYLGLAKEEADIISGVTTGAAAGTTLTRGAWNFWGVKETGNDIVDPTDGMAPHAQGEWDVVLQRVSIFLQQSGLSYRELLELLGTYFINRPASAGTPGGRLLGIVSVDAKDPVTCNLSKLEIQVIDDTIDSSTKDEVIAAWNRIHRFVRLWRKLGWTMRDLDKAITALNPADWKDGFLTQLSHIQRLRTNLNVPLVKILSWWANIDTDSYIDQLAEGQPEVKSLYEQLFQNRTAIKRDPREPDPFKLTSPKRDELAVIGKISERVPELLGALGISAAELSLLTATEVIDDKLNLSNLSHLYRIVSFSKALKLSVKEFVTVKALIGINPFDSTKIENTLLFVEKVRTISDSGFSIVELDYLLRHQYEASSGIVPTEESVALVLDEIRSGLQRIIAETAEAPDPTGDITRKTLALLNWDSSVIEQTIALLSENVTYEADLSVLPQGVDLPNDTGVYEVELTPVPSSVTIPPALQKIVTYDLSTHKLRTNGALTAAQKTILAQALPNHVSAVEVLFHMPDELRGEVTYDKGKLRFVGAMTVKRKARLNVHNDPNYTDAVESLFKAPRTFVARYLRTFSVQNFSELLANQPAGQLASLKFPDALKSKIYYDVIAEKLHFIGTMTESERIELIDLSKNLSDPNLVQKYQAAVNRLFSKPNAFLPQPPPEDSFLTSANASQFFDSVVDPLGEPVTPAYRFNLVLKKLLPHIRTALSENLVKQKLGDAFKLEGKTLEQLLLRWVNSPTHPAEKSITAFLAGIFVESNLNIKLTAAAFPDPFNTFALFHKVVLLIDKLKMTAEEITYLSAHGNDFKGVDPLDSTKEVPFDLNKLPLKSSDLTSALFNLWERLCDLFTLRDSLPSGEPALFDLFDQALAVIPTSPNADRNAAKQKYLESLSQRTLWPVEELETLIGPRNKHQQIGHLGFAFPDDYKDERMLLRVRACFKLMKRLGASAKLLVDWSKADLTFADARGIKNTVRAKYDDAQWLELAKALRDPLRERQRSALVSYLVAQRGVRDANELYKDFLIDVEMSPCMMTTRIKQAISSVQLFIQRGLMNLELEVYMTPKEAQKWSQWRKWYRVWEANRKVLLYPENWIEPELRDDKSPFYKDLENELLQSDVTMTTAEEAFLHYLEKLDQVAQLEIVGMYHQQEPAADNTGTGVDILHVFGRTYATPHIYFYRRLEDKVWSAWEKVDLDIEGDHLIPVAWNRRLYLFWAIFTEKSKKPTEKQRERNEEPDKRWEIKLAWSEYKNKSWSPKKVSKELLPHPKYTHLPKVGPLEPQTFSFKTRILQREQLSIECYGTAVQEYEPYRRMVKPGAQAITTNVQYLTRLLPAAIKFVFLKENTALRKSEAQKTKIVIKKASGIQQNILETTELNTLDTNGAVFSTVEFSDIIDCYLVSEDHAMSKLSTFVHIVLFKTGIGLVVNLIPWSPTAAKSPEFEIVSPEPKVFSMQGIGEFTLDDCNRDLTAVPASQVSHSMIPANLEPLQGTQIQSMTMVEYLNTRDTLGVSAILASTPGTFRLLGPHQAYSPRYLLGPFFYQDELRTYFASFIPASNGQSTYKIRFSVFRHPIVRDFIKSLNRFGIRGLLSLANQRLTDAPIAFEQYQPNPMLVDAKLPREDVDFENDGAYSLYNWELFFHTPFLIAMQLSKNQRFEEAQKWFHYIFDPTATDSPDRPDSPGIERFWRVKPFYDEARRGIQTFEALIADTSKTSELKKQVDKWESNPFKPHVIARIRVVAYMKAVVMRYIDNLIAWGDQLFRRDTLESINEATQLYILAAQILGRRPESIPARAKAKIQTFRTLDDVDALDSLSNAMVEIESFLAPSVAPSSPGGIEGGPPLRMQYFCTTGNDKLLGYWDTVSDRLFKTRHCMNIEGVERALPIFEPEIDPGLLVRAAAAGIDISSALNDINAAVPHYRFDVMVQKASELCNDVKALGGAFLSALEKRDAEALALLRSSHEVELLEAIRTIKQQQIEEANNTLESLRKYEDVVTTRQQYYLSQPFMNPFETGHIGLTTGSLIPMQAQLGGEVTAAVLHLIPDSKFGAPTTAGATYGGRNVASAVQAFGSGMGTTASILNTMGSLSATLGGYQRRQEDWTHQADLATKELQQVKKQIAAAEIRLAISEHELENHDLQIGNAKEIDAYMRDQKFTNQELYSWMVGQLSGIYFQSYQLAYDVAKRAERTYRYELGLRDSNFIQFGYWDSLKKGLLSGERLYHDLKRMDVAYLDQNKREHEITKHISLTAIDPIGLVKLKETGECFVSLPEALFDIDYPGHYMRRIKSVSITIPCVTGPYAGVNCTLTQLNSSIRHANTLSSGQYFRRDEDTRFSDSFGTIQSIVTSSGQNDSGLFEANMRDERYLPFEGQGAISTWRIQLPDEFKSFDYATISDVVLHVRYTARDGGGALREKVSGELSEAVNKFVQSEGKQGLARIVSLRHEFSTDWYRFLNPADTAESWTLKLGLTQDRFPLQFRGRIIQINSVDIFLKFKDINDPDVFKKDKNNPTPLGDYMKSEFLKLALILAPGGAPTPIELSSNDSFLNGLPHGVQNFESPKDLGNWSLAIKDSDIALIAESLRYKKSTASGVAHWRLKPDLRLRRGPQDAPRDIQVPLAPSGSRRVVPFAATVLRSLALLRYRSRASSHNDLTPLQGYRGLLASVFDLPWLVDR